MSGTLPSTTSIRYFGEESEGVEMVDGTVLSVEETPRVSWVSVIEITLGMYNRKSQEFHIKSVENVVEWWQETV